VYGGSQRIFTLQQAAEVAFFEGDAAVLKSATDELERIGDLGGLSSALPSCRGLLALLHDDLHAAAQHFEQGTAQLRFPTVYDAFAHLRLARIALALHDAGGAAERLATVQADTLNAPLPLVRGYADLLAAYIARSRGDATEAEALAQRALATASQHEISIVRNFALETLALLAGDRDELDYAARLIGATEAFRARTGLRWRDHHCRADFDALRARLPVETLAEGEHLSMAEVAAYASRGHGERGRPGHGWSSLTPSEQRIVELVAAGLPNAAIAKRLFVSLATVKTHLVHVYAKLGIETRAELAAAATAQRIGTALGQGATR
jgi:DNA-binding CsgD family transcriptional regulator